MTSPNETNAPAPKTKGNGLSGLIQFVGDENVKIQYLSQALKEAKTNKKGETTITFFTKAANTNDLVRPLDDSNIGIVMWIPKKKIDEYCKS